MIRGYGEHETEPSWNRILARYMFDSICYKRKLDCCRYSTYHSCFADGGDRIMSCPEGKQEFLIQVWQARGGWWEWSVTKATTNFIVAGYGDALYCMDYSGYKMGSETQSEESS